MATKKTTTPGLPPSIDLTLDTLAARLFEFITERDGRVEIEISAKRLSVLVQRGEDEADEDDPDARDIDEMAAQQIGNIVEGAVVRRVDGEQLYRIMDHSKEGTRIVAVNSTNRRLRKRAKPTVVEFDELFVVEDDDDD